MNKLLYILTCFIMCCCLIFCKETAHDTLLTADEKDIKDALNISLAKVKDSTQLCFLADKVNHLVSQDSLTAFLHRRTGKAFYDKDLFKEAKSHYEKALTLQIKVTPSDTEGLAKSYFRLGLIHHELQNINQAHQYYKKGVQLVQSFSLLSKSWVDPWRLLFTYEADSYAELGDYEQSLQKMQLVLNQSIKFKDSIGIAQSYKRLGTTYSDAKRYTQSVNFLEKALPLLTDSLFQATTKNNLAFSYRHIAQYNKAIVLLNQAVLIFKALKEEEYLADAYSELAQAYFGKADFKTATNWSYLSLNSWLKTKPSKAVEAYRVLGDIAFRQQQPDSASFFYQKALQTLDTTFKNNDILKNLSLNPKKVNRKVELIEILAHKATSLSILYQKKHDTRHLQAALETYQLADKVVQVLRREMSDDASKYFWNETALPIYRKGITAAYALLELTKEEKYKLAALQFSERTKAPVLREGIADNDAKNLAFIPQHDLQCERELRSVIAIIEKNAAEGNNVDSQLSQARTKLYQFQESLKQKYPNYARHLDRLTDDTPLGISDIQNRLTDSTLVIEYAFDEDSSLYQFAITQTDFILQKKGLPKGFYQQAQRFIQSVSSDSLIKNNYKTAQTHYTESSFSLYQLLLEKNLLSVDTHKIKHICLIPEGILNFLPFDALTNKHVEEWQGRYYFERLLVNKYAFSRAFSLSPLHSNSSATPSVSEGLRADFVKLGAYAVDFKAKHWKADKKSKGELPNAKNEIDSIKTKFSDTAIYFNPTAIKNSFIRNAAHFDILHISTHGHSEGLLFEKKDSLDNDYELNIRDISVIPLHARLTFLSACDSGTGTMQEGEGVLSLGRAFMLSGSQAVMMTLWSIPDGSTAKIATRFYDNYQEGATADVALQKAQLYYMDNTQSDADLIPNKWAALTFISDIPFKSIQKQSLNWVCWLISLVIFTLIGLRFKSKR